MRFRTPGATTARSACSARWRRSARCRTPAIRPRRSIELILFTSEEPTRFGLGCLGSRLLSGTLDPARAASLQDAQGASLEEVRAAAGFAGPLAGVALPPGTYHAFVELHIEQGPLLERGGIPLGVVTAIAAPATLRHRNRRRGRACRRRADARSPRRICGRRGNRAGRGSGGQVHRRGRQRGDGRHLRSLSRSGQQHPQPRTHDCRRPRYRSGATRRDACRHPRALCRRRRRRAASRCAAKS